MESDFTLTHPNMFYVVQIVSQCLTHAFFTGYLLTQTRYSRDTIGRCHFLSKNSTLHLITYVELDLVKCPKPPLIVLWLGGFLLWDLKVQEINRFGVCCWSRISLDVLWLPSLLQEHHDSTSLYADQIIAIQISKLVDHKQCYSNYQFADIFPKGRE